MAKIPPADPTLGLLVRAVDEALDAELPLSLNVRGTRIDGRLISQAAYYCALTRESPLLAVLDPRSDLSDHRHSAESPNQPGRYLHLLGDPEPDGPAPLWRLRQDAIDAWTLRSLTCPTRGDQHEGDVLGRLFGTIDE